MFTGGFRSGLVVRRQHSHPSGRRVCECWRRRTTSQLIDASGALDLTFASRYFGRQGSERQIRSTRVFWRLSCPRHEGTPSPYCVRPSSSLTQCIFSETQMCSVGAKALRSSNTASATPAAEPSVRQENSRVPQRLQNTRSSLAEVA